MELNLQRENKRLNESLMRKPEEIRGLFDESKLISVEKA